MMIITGAAGFIGSCMAAGLNAQNFRELVLVDDFSRSKQEANYRDKQYIECVEREGFFEWVSGKEAAIQFIFHLGARDRHCRTGCRSLQSAESSVFQRNLETMRRSSDSAYLCIECGHLRGWATGFFGQYRFDPPTPTPQPLRSQ